MSYQFRVSPLSPKELEGFSQAIQGNSQPYGFTVKLTNSAGFNLCDIQVKEYEIQRELDESGRSESLTANTSTSFECSLENYSQASSWNFTWKLPFPTVVSNLPPGATIVPLNKWRMMRKGMSKDDVRKLLGEPKSISAGVWGDSWYYPDVLHGKVEFDKQGRVTGWTEP